MPDAEHPDRFQMSFGDHLEELRKRLLWGVVVPLPVSIIVFVFRDPVISWLYQPLDRALLANDLPQKLQALGPAETLTTQIKLSIIGAIILSAPWILLQAWKFIKPGLYVEERRFVHFLIPLSSILTLAGLALMYYVMLPLMLQVLLMFGSALQVGASDQEDPRVQEIISAYQGAVPMLLNPPEEPAPGDVWTKWPQAEELYVAVEALATGPGGAAPVVEVKEVSDRSMISQEFRLSTYVDFVLMLMLAIALAFQMPLVIVLLGWLGLATPAYLRGKRRYALFICGIIAAVVTPADALSMIMMLIPLYALYELGILMLIFAPAKAVRAGTVISGALSHKDAKPPAKDDESSQTNRPDPRAGEVDQPSQESTDDQTDEEERDGR